MLTKSPFFRQLKLTEEIVINILNEKTLSAKEIAKKYGVGDKIVYSIHKGEVWKHITLDPQYERRVFNGKNKKFAKKLTEAAVIDIMTDRVSTAKELAARYGINPTQIYAIHKGRLWKKISCDPKYTPRIFNPRKLTAEAVQSLKNGEVKDLKAFAKQYGVSHHYLYSIKNDTNLEVWKTIRPTVANATAM